MTAIAQDATQHPRHDTTKSFEDARDFRDEKFSRNRGFAPHRSVFFCRRDRETKTNIDVDVGQPPHNSPMKRGMLKYLLFYVVFDCLTNS